MPEEKPLTSAEELEEWELEMLKSRAANWGKMRIACEAAIQTVSPETLPATVQAYETVLRGEDEARERIVKLIRKRNPLPLEPPPSSSVRY